MTESKRTKEIREAVANYMWSEGCSCCRNTEVHDEAKERLAKLLNVPRYDDDSGYDFYQFKSAPPPFKIVVDPEMPPDQLLAVSGNSAAKIVNAGAPPTPPRPAFDVSAMVDAFLSWKLPDTFAPDGGVSFDRMANGKPRKELGPAWWPVGTNLLTAKEARGMFEYVLSKAKAESGETSPSPDECITGPRPRNKQVPEQTISDECKYCAEGEPEWSPDAKCWIHRRERLDKRCTRKRLGPCGEIPMTSPISAPAPCEGCDECRHQHNTVCMCKCHQVAPSPRAEGQPQLQEILCGAAQILDVVKQEWGESWSEWDQSIRDGITTLMVGAPPEKGGRS